MLRSLAALALSLALVVPALAQDDSPAPSTEAGVPAEATTPAAPADAGSTDDAASTEAVTSAQERAGERAEIGTAAAPGTADTVNTPALPDLSTTSAVITTPAGGQVPDTGASFEDVGDAPASPAEATTALESAPGTSLGSDATEPEPAAAAEAAQVGPAGTADPSSEATTASTPTASTPTASTPAGLDTALSQEPERGALSGSASSDQAAAILARQRGQVVDDGPRTVAQANSAGAIAGDLAAGASDSDVYRAIRYGTEDVVTSTRLPESRVLIQTGGMRWLEFRRGPLPTWGGVLLLGVIALLAVFLLVRGRVRIDGGRAGRTILRFSFIERFAHWLLSGSFVLLALTGLVLLFGREQLIPLMGPEVYAALARVSIWTHNNVSWAFMTALVVVFLFWVAHNIPSRLDLTWLAKGGGFFSKGVHVPAKKFNAGQKIVFWVTIILGASISLSGLSLLFPYELPLFAKTFEVFNATGIPAMVGLNLPVDLAPQEEMQLSQLWHAIMAFLMMAVILAHIYIGSVGMEGAFSAMGSGSVDLNWAREHHSLWVDKVEKKDGRGEVPAHAGMAPAE